MAARLRTLWSVAGAGGIVDALFGETGLFRTHWVASPQNRDLLNSEILARPGETQP
jgi:hypothetical protein